MRGVRHISCWGFLGLALLSAASPAMEQENTYVDLTIGYSQLDRTTESNQVGSFDDHDTSFGIVIGNELHRNLAIEISYRQADGFNGTHDPCSAPEVNCIAAIWEYLPPVEANLELWTLTLNPQWTRSRFTFFGKVGGAYYEEEIVLDDSSNVTISNLSGTELLLGAGLRVRIAKRFDLIVEHDLVDFDFASSSLGIGYRF